MENPRHYHQIEPAPVTVRVKVGQRVLAQSDRALVLKEVGKKLYDSVYYFPRDAVPAELLRRSKTRTHCPIKGEASYFTVVTAEEEYPDLVWSYEDPIPRSERIRELLAFDARRVTVELIPREFDAGEVGQWRSTVFWDCALIRRPIVMR